MMQRWNSLLDCKWQHARMRKALANHQESCGQWPMWSILKLLYKRIAGALSLFPAVCHPVALNHNFAASNSLIFTAKINKYVFAEYNTHMIIICF